MPLKVKKSNFNDEHKTYATYPAQLDACVLWHIHIYNNRWYMLACFTYYSSNTIHACSYIQKSQFHQYKLLHGLGLEYMLVLWVSIGIMGYIP